MGAYDTMDVALAGMKPVLDCTAESWVCAEADGISFGLPGFSYLGEAKKLYKYYNDAGKLVFDGDFVTSNVITITVDGEDAADVTFTTDHDTTADLVVAAVAALDDVDCVLDSTDTDNRTFIIRKKGVTLVVSEAITGGAGQVTGTWGDQASGQVYVGVAMFTQKSESLDTSANEGYEQYDSVNVMTRGRIYVEAKATVEANNEAYVDNSGADIGEFSSAGAELSARYRTNGTSGSIVEVETDGQKEMTYASSF